MLDAHHLTLSAMLWSCRLKAELNCNDCYTSTVGGGGWSSLPPSKESRNALCRAVELSNRNELLGTAKRNISALTEIQTLILRPIFLTLQSQYTER